MMLLFAAGAALAAFLWIFAFSHYWDKNIKATLAFCEDYVYAGERAGLTECIENRKRMMIPVLEVAFQVQRELVFSDFENTSVSDYTYKRDIFSVLGNQRITRKLELSCTKRGLYKIDKINLTAFSLLHSYRYASDCSSDTVLHVYAAETDISEIALVCDRLMGSRQCARRLYEDPFAFASIREYTLTDPMKTINWKASARTGELMVNTFESTVTEQVMIYVDLEDSGILKHEYLTEDSISTAASLARRFLRQGMEVGVCANAAGDETILEPACGNAHLTKIEQMLSDLTLGDHVPSLASVLTDAPQEAVVIVISKNPGNQTAIEAFARDTEQLIWVLPLPQKEVCNIRVSDDVCLIWREVSRN